MSERRYASPVSSQPFFSSPGSGLWVEVDRYSSGLYPGGARDRHSRSSCDRLYDLLTYEDPGPAYTKKGKLRVHQPAKHQDESAAFYNAQCIHYGLKESQTKPASKKALLEAFGGSRKELQVPDSIRKIERDLAAEYEVKNVAAEKKYREDMIIQKAAEEKARKKRKQEESDLFADVLGNPSKKAKSTAPLDVKTLSGFYNIFPPALSDG